MTKLLQIGAVFIATFLGAIIAALSAYAIGFSLAYRHSGYASPNGTSGFNDYYAAGFLCTVCPSFAALMGLLCGCLVGIRVAKAIPKEMEEWKRQLDESAQDVDDTADSELEYECNRCHTKQKFELRALGTIVPCKVCGASIDVGANEWSDNQDLLP